jgi:prepilin-type N-terminal cleavage/methylation domain-containing protein
MSRRAFSLVEILVVVVILVILMALFLPRYLGRGLKADGPGKNPETPIQRGHSVECINNLSQLRQALKVAEIDEAENRPATLNDLGRGFPASMLKCPVGGQAYAYDPAAGRVGCVQPGHERH